LPEFGLPTTAMLATGCPLTPMFLAGMRISEGVAGISHAKSWQQMNIWCIGGPAWSTGKSEPAQSCTFSEKRSVNTQVSS
jgi:hypothetical protein